MINVYPKGPLPGANPDRELGSIRDATIRERRSVGMAFSGEHLLSTAVGKVACFEFHSPSEASGACYFLSGHPISIRFSGDQARLDDLYRLIATAKLVQ
jgi:hypothetical protein